MKGSIACAVLLSCAAGQGAGSAGDLIGQVPEKFSRVENPYRENDRAVRAGAKLYHRECAACHGDKGIDRAPRLDSRYVKDAAPGALFWVLRNGSLRKGMPSFAHLPEAQRWQIIAYLQSGPRLRR